MRVLIDDFVWIGFDQGYIAWAIGDTSKFVPSTKEYLKKFLKV